LVILGFSAVPLRVGRQQARSACSLSLLADNYKLFVVSFCDSLLIIIVVVIHTSSSVVTATRHNIALNNT